MHIIRFIGKLRPLFLRTERIEIGPEGGRHVAMARQVAVGKVRNSGNQAARDGGRRVLRDDPVAQQRCRQDARDGDEIWRGPQLLLPVFPIVMVNVVIAFVIGGGGRRILSSLQIILVTISF